MLLFSAGVSAILPAAPGARRPHSPSPAVIAAIGVSIAVHAGLGVYLYTHKFTPTALKTDAAGQTVIMESIRLPAAPPPRSPPPASKPAEAHPRLSAPTPFALPTDNFVPLKPEPTVDVQPPRTETPSETKTTPPPSKVIVQPHWLSMPTADELADAYPERAQELGRAGQVELTCSVALTGAVRDCAVASEDPQNMGFGAAAQKVSRYFRMTPETENGQAVGGGTVRISIRFKLAD